MSTREAILTGGSPWGFRMHGGSETGQPLRISRVNPGSKAAQKGVREGDIISSINGQPTRTLSNSDAHALLRNAGQSLRLGLNEDCGGSPKRRSYKMATSQSSSASIQSDVCRNDSTKRASASGGGEGGGPSRESGEESKQPDKDRPTSRRRGGACRGRRNDGPSASPSPAAAAEDAPREEATPTCDSGVPEWVEEGPESGSGGQQRSRKARKGVRERRKARLRAAGLSGGEASGGEGRSGPEGAPEDERPPSSDPGRLGSEDDGNISTGVLNFEGLAPVDYPSALTQDKHSSEVISKQFTERISSAECVVVSETQVYRVEEQVFISESRESSLGNALSEDSSRVESKPSPPIQGTGTNDLGVHEGSKQGYGVQCKGSVPSETPTISCSSTQNSGSEPAKDSSKAASTQPSVHSPSVHNADAHDTIEPLAAKTERRVGGRRSRRPKVAEEEVKEGSGESSAPRRSSPVNNAVLQDTAEPMAGSVACIVDSKGSEPAKAAGEDDDPHANDWREVGRGGKEVRRAKEEGKEVLKATEGGEVEVKSGKEECVDSFARGSEGSKVERGKEGRRRRRRGGDGEADEGQGGSETVGQLSEGTCAPTLEGGAATKARRTRAVGAGTEESEIRCVDASSSAIGASPGTKRVVEKEGGNRNETPSSTPVQNTTPPGDEEKPGVQEGKPEEDVGFTRVSRRRRRRDVNCDVPASSAKVEVRSNLAVVCQTEAVEKGEESEKMEPKVSSVCEKGSGCRREGSGEELKEIAPSRGVELSGGNLVSEKFESNVSSLRESGEEFPIKSRKVVYQSEAVVEVLEEQKFESLASNSCDSGLEREKEVEEDNENSNRPENSVDSEDRKEVLDESLAHQDTHLEGYEKDDPSKRDCRLEEKDPVSIGGGKSVAASDQFNKVVERVARSEILCTEWKTVEEFCSSDCDMSTEFEIVSVARKASSHVTATAVTLLPPQEGSSKLEDIDLTTTEEGIVEATNEEVVSTTGNGVKVIEKISMALSGECSSGKDDGSNDVNSKEEHLCLAVQHSSDKNDGSNDLTSIEENFCLAEEWSSRKDDGNNRVATKEIVCPQGDLNSESISLGTDVSPPDVVFNSPSGAVHGNLYRSCSPDKLADPLGDENAPSRSPISPFPLPPLPPPPFSPPSSRSSPVPFNDPSAIHPPFSGILHSHKEAHPVTDLPHLSSLPSSPVPCSTPPPSSFIPEEFPQEVQSPEEEKTAPTPLRLTLPLPPEGMPDFESSEEGVLNFDTHCRSPFEGMTHSPLFMGEVSTTPPLPRCARTPTPPASPTLEASSIDNGVDAISTSSPSNNSHVTSSTFPPLPGDENFPATSFTSDDHNNVNAIKEKDPNVLSGDSLSLEETPEPIPEMPEEAYIRRILRSMNIEEGEFRSRVISSRSDGPSPSRTGRKRRPERMRAGTFPPGSSRKPLEVIVEEEKHSGSGEESGSGGAGRMATNSSRRRKKRIRRESEGSSSRELKTSEESSGEEGEYFPWVIEGLVRKVEEPPDAPAMQGPAEVVVIEEVEDAEESGEWSQGWREEEFVEGEEEGTTEDKGEDIVVVEDPQVVEAQAQPPLTRRMSRELFMIPESDEEREERDQTAAVEILGDAGEESGDVEAGKPAPELETVSPGAALDGEIERTQVEGMGGGDVAVGCKTDGEGVGGVGMLCETQAGRHSQEAGVGLEAKEGAAISSFHPSVGGDAAGSGDLQNKCDTPGVAEDKTAAPSSAGPVSVTAPQVTIPEESFKLEGEEPLSSKVDLPGIETSPVESHPNVVDEEASGTDTAHPEAGEVREVVTQPESKETTGKVALVPAKEVNPVKEIPRVYLQKPSEDDGNTSVEMEAVDSPPKPGDDEETSVPEGSEPANLCYDVGGSVSEDEEMLRSAEAALEAYYAGRESSRSPSTTTSQCTEICRGDQPESLLQMCVKTVSTLPYGMAVLREIWTSTPPVREPERDRRRSSAPSPESRSEGESKGGEERLKPGEGEKGEAAAAARIGQRRSPISSQCTSSSDPELDQQKTRVHPSGQRADLCYSTSSWGNADARDSNRDLWVPIPTSGNVNICLSPKQLEAFVPDPSQAARLLDMHVKFLERRGYHEVMGPRGSGGKEREDRAGGKGVKKNVEEEEELVVSSRAQIRGRSSPLPPGGGEEAVRGGGGGGVEGSRLLPMLLGEGPREEEEEARGGGGVEEEVVEDSKRSLSGVRDSSHSAAGDSPRSLPGTPSASPRCLGPAAIGMGLLPGEVSGAEGPSSPSSVGSGTPGDERRLKARALSEWLNLARSDGNNSNDVFSPYSEDSPRSFCSPPPGGNDGDASTEAPPTVRVCDVIRRFEMTAAASGFKTSKAPVRYSLCIERKRSDAATDGPVSNPGGGGESPGAKDVSPTEEIVQKRQFDAEKYRISKQGDIAIEIAGASELSGGNHGRNRRPVSMPPAVTGGEIFRQQMYMEYMHKVAERAERKQHKVIKLTARAGNTEVGGQSGQGQGQQQGPGTAAALAPTEELFVSEFMGKVRQRMERVGVTEDEESSDRVPGPAADGSPGGGGSKPGADEEGPPQFIIEGGLKELPKHLREDTDLLLADDEVDIPVLRNLGLPHATNWRRPRVCGRCTNPAGDAATSRPKGVASITGNLLAEIDSALGGALQLDGGSIALAPTFKATAVRPPGVWTPSKSAEDLRVQPPSQPSQQSAQKESGASSSKEGDFTDDVAPVWVPKSAGPSPTLERKEFRPVNFDASSLTRKKEGQSRSLASSSPAPEESFAWQSKETSETSRSVTVTSERRSFVQSPTSPGASYTSHLPKAQNPTITLLQKAREGQLPRGAHYLDDKEMGSKENDANIMYTVKKEYETEEDKRKRKIVELAPKKFEGIGPTTKEGIPIILRSGIKEENQAKWYKKMYESLHCPGKDDEYVTVRYKTRRGRYPYTSAEGYLSEPDPIGYDSDMGYSAKYATLDRRRIKNKDYNFTTSTMPRSKYIPPSTKYGPEVYKNQPGRIEDYEPGHSSIAEKEAKLWWDEVLDIFDGHANQSSPPTKPFMTHALKESGYESDSTLLFKRREENMQSLSPMEQKQAYKTIQMGGEVPLHGLRKPAPERPKESPHKYVESEVTIHYRSPIRAQAKEALPEEELARRQEEAMRRIYQEERRRKYLQELQDMESRRHTDNFTPSQKSPIPLNRYDNFLDDVPSKSKLRDHTPEPKVVARALYNFVGQTSRELSFRRGDIIFVRRQIDKNWYEGEHNAMIGLFPFNYVEIIPYDGIRTIPKRPTEGQARAKYNFVAQTHLELSLIKGELVVLTRQVDNNWFEGRIGNRRGIFPISYVEVLVDPGERPVTPSSKPTTMKSLTSPVSSSLLLNGSSVLSNTAHSQQPYHQQYLGKQQKQYQAPVSYTAQKTTTFTSSLGRNPYSSKTRPSAAQKLQIPSVNQTLHIDTHSDPVPYRALYNYKPQNEDELELQEGDTVYVMEKCDDGWYVGSSHRTGYFGTFPGNYVERI